MRPLAAPEILSAWESGRNRPLVDRGLSLLLQACPDESWDDLASLPVGVRDARLLTLREWTFGSRLTGLTSCPACNERLEVSFSVDDLRSEAPSPPDEILLSVAGCEISFRLPNSHDLMVLADTNRTETVSEDLLERCLLEAHRDGVELTDSELPPEVSTAIVDAMGEADPQADVHTALECPSCGHGWRASFDIVGFFWAEIETWAFRTLHQVHVLARAYGWREADILALDPWRRQFYLNMVSR